MKLIISILLIVAGLVDAAPTSSNDTSLQPRQLLTANPSISCCASCTAAYDATTYFHAFDDFCTWAGDYLKLWTTQTYATFDKYCAPGGSSCIQLSVQYLCGQPGGNEGLVTYTGCMVRCVATFQREHVRVKKIANEGCQGYFNYAINPFVGCGGPPFAGARIESSNECWIFQATADAPIPAHGNCDDYPQSCSPADREWGEAVQTE